MNFAQEAILAVQAGDLETLRRIPGFATPQDDRGWLLRIAVDLQRPDLLRALLELGLDPDARVSVDALDSWGMPLYACVRGRDHVMAEILLLHGADPNGRVYASGTPLSEAYGQRDERMIALLRDYGGRPNASMAGFYRRKNLALELLAAHGDTPLPDDGFSSGPVAAQLVAAAARGGDPEILELALERVDWPHGDRRWYAGLASATEFWNHWTGPWCHPEWDRGGYLRCFERILERLGPPDGAVLARVSQMGAHVLPAERAAFHRAATRAILDRDPVWAAYAIGDLGPALAPNCEWFAEGEDLALVLRAFDVPVLWVQGERFAGALEALDSEPRISLTLREQALSELAARFDTSRLQLMWRMHLDPAGFQPVSTAQTSRLDGRHTAALECLYADGEPAGEAPDFFFERMVTDGIFHGVWEDGGLIAAAGTHLAAPSEGVAAIGNVYTRRDRRGRGLAAAVTSAVAAEAFASHMDLVVLNVKLENQGAMRVYERLGFRKHCQFLEGVVERRS